MKHLSILLALAITLALLLPACSSVEKVASDNLRLLHWFDEEQKEVLFTVRDIEVFDWNKQIFKLSTEADKRLQNRFPRKDYGYNYYSVRDKEGVIYSGYFSNIFEQEDIFWSGPFIYTYGLIFPHPFYSISQYYCISKKKDIRYSDRLFDRLKEAGVLGEINPKNLGPGMLGLIPLIDDDRESLRWIDKKTGYILFTLKNIEIFDWENQKFKLKNDPLRHLCYWIRANVERNRPFVVRDSESIVYEGELITSEPPVRIPGGPWIDVSECMKKDAYLEYFEIKLLQGDEIHRSDRIKSALEKAGVLGTIETQEQK